MKFVIRDDDTCFWTTPDDLEQAFGAIWNDTPVSLACVPFNSGKLPGGMDHDPDSSAERFPIADNAELVRAIRAKIESGQISIMQHGWSHQDIDGTPEYVDGSSLATKTIEGKNYLESTFSTEISTFVPPHNSIGTQGTRSVVSAGMNILHAFSHRPSERSLGFDNLWNFSKTLILFAKYRKRRRWPHPYRFHDHQELGAYLLNKDSSVEELKAVISATHRRNGIFCLATHYWEINRDNLQPALAEIVEFAKTLPGTEFTIDKSIWSR
jgi:hypothetical protein